MGFLDQSTNNIIIDAVLTDTGRAFLARNDGSFSVIKFALGDDEVDYTIIPKYGRSVGKEKIEKNTPVFEAQTNGNQALKHRLIGISNPNLLRLPRYTLTGDGLNSEGTSLAMTRTGSGGARMLTMTQTVALQNTIDSELQDLAVIVKLPNRFLEIAGTGANSVDSNGVATYVPRKSGTTPAGGGIFVFTLSVKAISDIQFLTWGNSDDKNTISSVVSVSGMSSGATKEFEVTITK